MKLVNSFSLNMLPAYHAGIDVVQAGQGIAWLQNKLDEEFELMEIGEDIDPIESYIGHETTAQLLGVPFRRETLKLKYGETILVAQYNGPRLPEGSTVLPDGADFTFVYVRIHDETVYDLKKDRDSALRFIAAQKMIREGTA